MRSQIGLATRRTSTDRWPIAAGDRRPSPVGGCGEYRSISLAFWSPAARATNTWKLVAAELNMPPQTRIDDRLYAASGDELLAVVRDLPDDVETAILVGHNPGMEDWHHFSPGSRRG
jgi:phosphohistidine phosphatase SixA